MRNAELVFRAPEAQLSVRSFSIEDGLSRPFEVLVTASSDNAEIDFESIIGRGAALRLATGDPARPYRSWSGLCSHFEQTGVEEDGSSLYLVRIVPMLWRLGLRRCHRIFQHRSAAEIVAAILAEWRIVPELLLEPHELCKHDYRVQYGETDLAFVSRLLEEDGISYGLDELLDDRGTETTDDDRMTTRLFLTTAPQRTGRRLEAPLPFLGRTDDHDHRPFVADVRIGRSLRPGRYTAGGYDFRASPELRLLAEARAGIALEERYEVYGYDSPAFTDGSGRERARYGREAAARELERARTLARRVRFRTNELALDPGVSFSMLGHPRAELAPRERLLVVARRIDGESDGLWRMSCEASLCDDPFRPERRTPKPRVMGLHSAIVVGPAGEEVHTDEHGRVKVQFHWDREGMRDEHSSCWMRVSQPWAGAGYGMHQLPRVGHEVLVDFLEGDPDQPVVIGSVHNSASAPPDRLPRHKTRSTWRSSSSPGGGGFNEISFEDARGEELLYLRAERDLERLVRHDERATIRGQLSSAIAKDESRSIGGEQHIAVDGNRRIEVGGRLSERADAGVQLQAGRTGLYCEDGKLILTNGTASIVLDGPHVRIDALDNVRISAGGLATVSGKQVYVDGTPEVFLNSAEPLPPHPAALPLALEAEAERGRDGRASRTRVRGRPGGRLERPGGLDEVELGVERYFDALLRRPLDALERAPKRLRLPAAYGRQLQSLGREARSLDVARRRLLDPDTYTALERNVERRIDRETQRLETMGRRLHATFERQRDHVADLGTQLGQRLEAERRAVAGGFDEFSAILAGERGNLLESARAMGDLFNDGCRRVVALRQDLTSMLARERGLLEQYAGEWQREVRAVQDTIDGIQKLVDNPEDALLEAVLGKDKQLAKDIQTLAEPFGYGDEVGDFFGLGGSGGGQPAPHPGPHPPAHPGPHPGPHPPPHPGPHPPPHPGPHPPPHPGQHPGQHPNLQRGFEPTPQASTASVASRGHGEAAPHAVAPSALSRSGGLAAGDVTSVLSDGGAAMFETPREGQLLVLPSAGAQPIDQAALSARMVDAQMAGRPVADAVSRTLAEQGYAVYQRGYGDYSGELVRAAAEVASPAKVA